MASFTATLRGATRKNNRRNGNPTWELNTSEGCYLTVPDGGIGYEVANRTGGLGNWTGQRVQFTTNKKNRVTHWQLAK